MPTKYSKEEVDWIKGYKKRNKGTSKVMEILLITLIIVTMGIYVLTQPSQLENDKYAKQILSGEIVIINTATGPLAINK